MNTARKELKMKNRSNEITYHLMLLPGMIILIMFAIVPMFGIIIAFENFIPPLGIFHSPWVGLDNFKYMFQIHDGIQAFINTIIIAFFKIVANLVVPLIFALLLNEIRLTFLKRASQTIIYLPFFLSWVILAGVLQNVLDLNGPINQLIAALGGKPIQFLTSNVWFVPILIITETWKSMGFNIVIYLAAIIGINPGLYEAAEIDGALRHEQLWHITIPGITPTIVLLATLSLGSVLSADFDQVFNLYNPLVYQTGDIIDTYVYRMGIMQAQYGLATAVGTMKSVISFFLIILSYKLASKYANYRIF
jgi:putative aldouronate transport system permease protein